MHSAGPHAKQHGVDDSNMCLICENFFNLKNLCETTSQIFIQQQNPTNVQPVAKYASPAKNLTITLTFNMYQVLQMTPDPPTLVLLVAMYPGHSAT